MKEDWIKHIRRRMENHRMKEPDGLWESIDAALGNGVVPKAHGKEAERRHRAAFIPLWMRAVLAAAVVAAAVMTVYRKPWDGGGNGMVTQQDIRAARQETAAGTPAKRQTTHTREPSAHDVPDYIHTASAPPHIMHGKETSQTESHDGTEAETYMAAADKGENREDGGNTTGNVPDGTGTERKETQPEKRKETERDTPTGNKRYGNLYEDRYGGQTDGHTVAHDKGVGIGISVSNGMLAYNGASSGILRSNSSILHSAPLHTDNSMPTTEMPGGMIYYGTTPNPIPNGEEVHHDIPVKFGLSIRYAINGRWAVESGINYSRLRSTFSSGNGDSYSHTVQKLNYAGIPVSLIYTLWNNKGLSVYAAAGGEAAKCISGSRETETVLNGVRADESSGRRETARPWQLSVNGAVGIQYSFVRSLSLYAEPSLGYYFGDGSSLDTYYSRHPLSPGVRIGLRLNIR